MFETNRVPFNPIDCCLCRSYLRVLVTQCWEWTRNNLQHDERDEKFVPFSSANESSAHFNWMKFHHSNYPPFLRAVSHTHPLRASLFAPRGGCLMLSENFNHPEFQIQDLAPFFHPSQIRCEEHKGKREEKTQQQHDDDELAAHPSWCAMVFCAPPTAPCV